MKSRRGAVAILAAIVFPILIAMAGLAIEYGLALVQKAQYQRVADLAAYAGATSYSATSSTSSMSTQAKWLANLNGVASSGVSIALVSSPSGDGNQAVKVVISGSRALSLVSVLGAPDNTRISASAYAELRSAGPACIMALSQNGSGVTLSGGTSVSAPGCSVGSNATVAVPNGTSLTALRVTYDSAASPGSISLSNIHAPPGKSVTIAKAATSDPLAGNGAVSSENDHLNSVALMSPPGVPNVSTGNDVSFGWKSTSMSVGGCSATRSSGTWTVTCSGNGPFSFGTISVGGGITLLFNTSGSPNAVYDFSGDINASSGAAWSFGPGTYNVSGGIILGGGVSVSFGAGTFNLGKLVTSCGAGKGYSICNAGTSLTIAGPSTFSLAGGIYNSGGSILTLGTPNVGNTTPSTNSFDVGAANDGNSLNMGGGAKTTFADATGAGDVFQMTGNVQTQGGSCLVISAAASHDINGSINASGGLYVGAGVYSVEGYVAFGSAGGGDVTCVVNGTSQSLGVSGTNVSFGIAGATTPGSGPCADMAFCVAAGYGHVNLTAPSSGTMENLLVSGPSSGANTAGASFAEGASGTSLSGVFYIPNGPITLSGAGNVGSGAGQCLQLIGSQVSLSGGSALATACSGMGASGSVTPLLVD